MESGILGRLNREDDTFGSKLKRRIRSLIHSGQLLLPYSNLQTRKYRRDAFTGERCGRFDGYRSMLILQC